MYACVQDDLVTLRLRDGSGILSGEDFTLSTSEVKPMEPCKNAKVKIVGGSMNVGKVGVVVVSKIRLYISLFLLISLSLFLYRALLEKIIS